jgi:hypothetical protein
MSDALGYLDAIETELRRSDRKIAASSQDAVTRYFEKVLILISDSDLLDQVHGAHVLCSLYLSDLGERSRPSGLNVALASLQRLRAEIRATLPTK